MKLLIIIFSGIVAGTGCYRMLEAIWSRQWFEAVWVGAITLAIYLIGFRLVQEFTRP